MCRIFNFWTRCPKASESPPHPANIASLLTSNSNCVEISMHNMIRNRRNKNVTFQLSSAVFLIRDHGLTIVNFISAGICQGSTSLSPCCTRESHHPRVDRIPHPQASLSINGHSTSLDNLDSPTNHRRPVNCIQLSLTLF